MFHILVIFSVFASTYAQIDSKRAIRATYDLKPKDSLRQNLKEMNILTLRPVIHLPPAVSEVVKQITADCLKETKAEPEVAKRFFELKFDEDEISKKFLYCLGRKTNYVDEDGHLNDGIITLFDSSDRKENVQKVIETCNTIKKKNHLDTLFEIATCFYKNTPVLLFQ